MLQPVDFEYRVILPSKGLRVYGGHAIPVTEEDGSVVWYGHTADVTDKKALLKARMAAQVAQDANLAKNEFLSRVSHELRTPLNAVIGFAQLLRLSSAGQLNAAQRQHVEHIESAGSHLLGIISDVLDLSRIEAGNLPLSAEPCRPSELLAQASNMVDSLARDHGITLRAATLADDPLVRVDPMRLRQVLVNLLSNAIKYNQAGGHVRLLWQAEGARVSIAVEDDGCGIAEEDLPRLFQPFERLATPDPEIEGLGLGLSNVKRLLEAMGGSVEVHSRLGEGSRFTVSLQRMAAPVPDPALLPQALPPAAPLQARITYVEDDDTNVLLLQAMLAAEPGLAVTVCHDGTQALANPGTTDLWIVDGQLPDMDGVDLLRQLQRRPGPPPRAVMFSADALPGRREQALAAGFIDLWVKPMGRDELLLRLRLLLSRPRPEGQGVSAAPLAQ